MPPLRIEDGSGAYSAAEATITALANTTPPEPPTEKAPEPEGEGLDFTATGFAEMETACAEDDVSPEIPPEDGLDFEASAYDETEPEEAESTEPEPTQPIPTGDYADGAD